MTREEAIEVYLGLLNQKIKEAFEFFAPELAENDDERIRKFLIDMVKRETGFAGFPSQGQVLAYLEKQKERKPVQTADEKEYIRIIKSLIADLIRDKKPEDVAYYQKIYDWLDGISSEQKPVPISRGRENGTLAEVCYGPKVDPYPVGFQFDEIGRLIFRCFRKVLASFGIYAEDEILPEFKEETLCYYSQQCAEAILKSIRPSWKPSEEQMEALKAVIDSPTQYQCIVTELKTLYDELKKL